MTQKKKKTKTTYYHSRSQTSKNLFHSPQAYGELIRIPMTTGMRIISIVSVLIQLGLTAFAAYAAYTTDSIAALRSTGFAGSIIYLVLPIVTWLLTLGFRFACSVIPLEMWRLPMTVRKGMLLCDGRYLKLMTLLLELETAVCFVYIAVALYLGHAPSNWVLLIWVITLVFSVYLPGRKAAALTKK